MKRNYLVLLAIIFCFGNLNSSFGMVKSQDKLKLTILTANVAQLPLPGVLKRIGHMMGFGIGLSENKERAKRLSDKIREFDRQGRSPDILTFQELFDLSSASEIKDKIKKIYPYSNIDRRWGRKWGIGMQSGLAIFSKYPIVAQDIYEYKAHKGVENFARKGMMAVKIVLPNGMLVNIFTTHLQAGGSKKTGWSIFDKKKYADLLGREIRYLELKEAKENLINKFAIRGELVILTGDLNIDSFSEEDGYFSMLEILGLEDSINFDLSPEFKGSTWDLDYWKKEKKLRTKKDVPIDYILVSKQVDIPFEKISALSRIGGEFTPKISDHLELWGEIVF